MAAYIRCPECDERISLAGRERGSKIRCPECRFLFARDDADDRRPIKPRRVEHDDEDEEQTRSGLPLPAIIAGGVVGVLLLGIGLYFILRPAPKANPQPEIARGAIVDPNIDERKALVQDRIDNRPPPAAKKERPNFAVPRNTAPKNEVPKTEMPKVQKPPTPETDPATERIAKTVWSVPVDPLANFPEFPKKSEKISVPVPIGGMAYFPSSASPFFAAGGTRQKTDAITLFDLNTRKPAGTIRGKTDLQEPVAVSPDGKYLAGRVSFKPIVDVFEFANGQGVRRLEWKTGEIKWLDFGANSETLVVCATNFTESSLQVWEIATGMMARSIPLPKSAMTRLAVALSPGRQLAAVGAGGNVLVFRLSDGKLCGSQPFPDMTSEGSAIGSSECHGLAFSPDGAELAGLFGLGSHQKAVLAAWSIASGKTAFEHDLSDALNKVQFSHRLGEDLDYAPDGLAWLIANNVLVERESGTPLTQLQGEHPGRHPLRLLPNDTILTEDKSGRTLVSIPFNRTAYEAAAKAAREKAPTATAAVEPDRSAVKVVAAAMNPTWAVTEDAGPAMPKIYASIPLVNTGQAVRVAALGSPESGRAATLSTIEMTTPYIHKILRWDRYNLATGKHLGGVPLGIAKEPAKGKKQVRDSEAAAALSPSGARLAVRGVNDSRRVNIWSEDGKNLVGFLPAPNGGPVDWMAFVSDDKLITLAEGHLTLWEVPACKAIYETATLYRGAPAFSANRRWLAACQENGFDVIEVESGVSHGYVQTTGAGKDTDAPIAAFSPDGSKLACIVPASGQQNVIVCDVATGTTTEPFLISAFPGYLQWTGPGHLLYGSNLIDLESKMAIWQYSGPLLAAQGATDGRFWYIRGGSSNAAPGALAVATLPDAAAAQAIAVFRQPTTQMLVGPGTEIAIRINAAGPTGDAEFGTQLTNRLTQHLERRRLVVHDGAPLTLTVNGVVENTNESVQEKSIGGGSGKNRIFALRKITASATLADSAGRVVWQNQQEIKQAVPSRLFRGDEDPEKIMERDLWNSGSASMANPQIPLRAYVVNGNLFIPPGKSVLGGGR